MDLPNRVHALASDETEDFVMLDNHRNPFISVNDMHDDSSVESDSVEVKTVDDKDDDDDDNDYDSKESSSEDGDSDDDDDWSDDSDKHPTKERCMQ